MGGTALLSQRAWMTTSLRPSTRSVTWLLCTTSRLFVPSEPQKPCWVPLFLWWQCLIRLFITLYQHTPRNTPSPITWPTGIISAAMGSMALPIATLNERYAMLTATPPEQLKLLTLQLGSGCSATAIAAGRSVDASMGFTPLEGMMDGYSCWRHRSSPPRLPAPQGRN